MKLHSRKAGPFKVLQHLGSNAYLLELLPEMQFSPIFNVDNILSIIGMILLFMEALLQLIYQRLTSRVSILRPFQTTKSCQLGKVGTKNFSLNGRVEHCQTVVGFKLKRYNVSTQVSQSSINFNIRWNQILSEVGKIDGVQHQNESISHSNCIKSQLATRK